MSIKKLRVATVVGTRPEIIRRSRARPMLDLRCEHMLIHTGQNYDYELNDLVFDDVGIRKSDSYVEAAGASGSESIGKAIGVLHRAFAKVQPDAMLLLDD